MKMLQSPIFIEISAHKLEKLLTVFGPMSEFNYKEGRKEER